MSNRLGELELDEAARTAAGNWQHVDSFVWYRDEELTDPENWSIIYTHHRDSGLLDQSNASVIDAALQPFTEGDNPDVIAEHHTHWAVGSIDGYAIRVFRNGQITDAFRAYHHLAEQMAEYPILDEDDYSRREYEATLENIADSAWRLKDEYDLADGWEYEIYDWLSDHDDGELENVDDQGGYPSEESLRMAVDALGFRRVSLRV